MPWQPVQVCASTAPRSASPGSVIGGNVWITESVPPGSRVVAEPPRNVVHQPDAGEPDAIDLDAGPVRLEVRRDGEDVVFRALPPGEFALRKALASGETLETAIDSALGAESSLDVAAALRALFAARILVD